MAALIETALVEKRPATHPADDPRVFALLVEAAAKMFEIICEGEAQDADTPSGPIRGRN